MVYQAVPGAQPDGVLPVRERIAALDVVRGIAVGGILLANSLVFFGVMLMTAERAAALPFPAADRLAELFEHVFVEGKFYSTFSLLFGIGFGVQLTRGGADALVRYRRRLRVLLLIGAVHAFLIWAGDILMLYAILGFTLSWFARRTDADLLRWTVRLLALPTLLYLVAVVVYALVAGGGDTTAAGNAAGDIPPEFMKRFEAIGTGGPVDALIGNLLFLAGRWVNLFVSMRFPKVLGMFVLGLWAVRVGIALRPADHRALLVRWARLGWMIGLPANVIAALAFLKWSYLSPSWGGLVGVAAQAIGFPLLAIGYACTITLMVIDGRRLVAPFAAVGRMALTNYLTHSIVCATLAYGFGFALWWRVGAATAMAIGVGLVAVQIPVSAWWLRRFQFGPMEWVWRRLTYRQPLPMRRMI